MKNFRQKNSILGLFFLFAIDVLFAQTPYITSAEGGNKSAQFNFGIDAKVSFVATGPEVYHTLLIKSGKT